MTTLALLHLGAATAMAASIQISDTTVIPDIAACTACTIELARAAQFGRGAADSVSPIVGPETKVALGQNGGLLVLQKQSPNRVVFSYNADGRLAGTIGRAGDGPGEFRTPLSLATTSSGKSVHVFDARSRRMTVFGADGSLIRTAQLPLTPYDVLMLASGKMVLAVNNRSQGAIGQTLHLLSSDGVLERSFHPAVQFPSEMSAGPLPYLMASNPKGGFVVFDVRFLTFTMYDADGNVQRVLRRDVPWDNAKALAVDTARPRGDFERPYLVSRRPPTLLRAIHVDSAGRIWLLAALENPSWNTGGREWQPHGSGPSYLNTYWVGYAEVIDPISGKLLHAQRLPFVPDGLPGDGLLLRSTDDGMGSLQFELFQVVLKKAAHELPYVYPSLTASDPPSEQPASDNEPKKGRPDCLAAPK